MFKNNYDNTWQPATRILCDPWTCWLVLDSFTWSVSAGMTDRFCVSTLFCREVGSHGPQPEWNDPEPTFPQRLAEKSAHLV